MTRRRRQPPALPHVTDHALLRYIERRSGIDLEQLRGELSGRLTRAMAAAEPIGGEYRILLDGVEYVCVDNHVVTVLVRYAP